MNEVTGVSTYSSVTESGHDINQLVNGSSLTSSVRIQVDVVSDTVCPWCYIAKRRLETAIKVLADKGLYVCTRWRPFQLNPGMPERGMDRRHYRSSKFGSWERSRQLDAQVAHIGAQEGIDFRHDLIEQTPNTLNSHRLIWLACHEGGLDVQDLIVESIFSAYFVHGQDIGEPQVLAELGATAGLDRDRVLNILVSAAGSREVGISEKWARHNGVTSVPSIILDGAVLFSGALDAATMARKIQEATAARLGQLREVGRIDVAP